MSFKDSAGRVYATEQYRDEGQAALDAANKAHAEREARAAKAWEDGLKNAYLATPGATLSDWARDRDAVVSEARKRAALAAGDAARVASASRYG